MIRFNLLQQLRSGRWYIAMGVFLVAVVADMVWAGEKNIASANGAIIGLAVAFSFGIAADRSAGFEAFLSNFTSSDLYLGCKIAASIMLYVAFHLIVLVRGLIVSHSLERAAFNTAHLFLLFWLVVPLTLLIEVLVDVKFPATFALVLAFGCAAVLMNAFGADRVVAFIGLQVTPPDFRSLGHLLRFDLTWNVLPVMTAYGGWILRHRRRLVLSAE